MKITASPLSIQDLMLLRAISGFFIESSQLLIGSGAESFIHGGTGGRTGVFLSIGSSTFILATLESM